MKKWKKAPYLCLPVLALGMSVWAAPHMQRNKQKAPVAKSSSQEPIPAVPAAQPIQDAVKNTHAKAMAAGQFSCCIGPSCEFCIAHLAMCRCGKNVRINQPVCRECKGGWEAGEGRVPHINPHKVKVMTADMVRTAVKTTTDQGKKQGWEDTKKTAPLK